ncbi:MULTISPECIES: HD domain-containing protein [Olivibacter]|uniref:Metal dependent phosphohydrolase n=2 Tax=Sphingobacteriaceae TaxID=84566 RepID=F4CES8_SPHS2|nr:MULTISPECIES: HD domain-containing protein [unclassified Olivibacter]MDM8177471.1 HD domain-containing protein [Olivibacter sp. 47]QEK99922.1 HD domain-containing protein [Olivibacter sp. LS-1]
MTNGIILKTKEFVQSKLKTAEAGHDWFHVERVWKNARLILENETANIMVVELAALLHDIADSKFHDGDEELGPRITRSFLSSLHLEETTIAHVCNIIKNMSFKASLGKIEFWSKELEIVQDADRLDAIGAIGIARAFNYGGYKNRSMYDPAIKPKENQSKEEYKNTTAPTINHFYEKLLLLKDKMNTETGKRLAESRHQYMLDFLHQFFNEWEGKQ